MLNGKSILITGGTGSFGKAFVSKVCELFPDIQRLVVFSRDELKQHEMSLDFPEKSFPMLRFFIGDVRDRDRLRRALNGIDVVIHAAALKQVPVAEYNPMEFIHTNIIGSANVVEASVDAGVGRIIALSTDKAAAPVNLYGATKLCSDKLFVAANNYTGIRVRSTVVRYGNVMASRGSIIPHFLKCAKDGVLPITDPGMTRFNITLNKGIELVLWAIENAAGGEVIIPRIPSYRLGDLAEAIGPSCRHEIIGLRPGEKIHEEMITSADNSCTLLADEKYIVLPNNLESKIQYYVTEHGAKVLAGGFAYSSGENPEFLNIEQIRSLIVDHVDPDFTPI